MTDHEIIRLAIKAGLAKQMEDNKYRINQFNELKEFVSLVEQHERNESQTRGNHDQV